jgi:hypothetical protein
LEEAIEQLRELPEEEQNAAADVLFAYVSSDERHYHLQPASATITVKNPATANATLQTFFIAGVASLPALVTAERKTRASGACIGVARPTKLTVIGAFPFPYFAPLVSLVRTT